MSYHTRRSAQFGNVRPNTPMMGQRRGPPPPVGNNFVPGGQLAGSQQARRPPPVNQPAPKPAPQQQPQQQQQMPPQQNPLPQPPKVHPQPSHPVQQEPATPQKPLPSTSMQESSSFNELMPGAEPPVVNLNEGQSPPTSEGPNSKKKWLWIGNKTSKAERVRKRNVRLSRILQPKNAVMILNELVRNCTFNVDKLPQKIDAIQFKATVVFDGMEFAGTGRTKTSAKNGAAETALKYLVKTKKLLTKKTEDEEEMSMEVDAEEAGVLPWSHIASFAMYKLFNSWGEDFQMTTKQASAQDNGSQEDKPQNLPEPPKPAKKLPDNPEKMNPLMLMNQMLPSAIWEEAGHVGNPPNVVFTFRVTVEGKQFVGSGSNKKTAKKFAAFEACRDLLKVDYPADVATK